MTWETDSHCRATISPKVATAAQIFGEEDDISVIAITRAGVPEPTTS